MFNIIYNSSNKRGNKVHKKIIKSYINAGVDYRRNFYYYRDKDKKEADLIIDYVDHISPIEIKKGINPVNSNFNFNFLKLSLKYL